MNFFSKTYALRVCFITYFRLLRFDKELLATLSRIGGGGTLTRTTCLHPVSRSLSGRGLQGLYGHQGMSWWTHGSRSVGRRT